MPAKGVSINSSNMYKAIPEEDNGAEEFPSPADVIPIIVPQCSTLLGCVCKQCVNNQLQCRLYKSIATWMCK